MGTGNIAFDDDEVMEAFRQGDREGIFDSFL